MSWLIVYLALGIGFSVLDRRNITESVREVIFDQDYNVTRWNLLPWYVITFAIEIGFWPAIVTSIVVRSVLK